MTGNLPKPIKKQREVLYMPEAGHSAVLGTAGSGKTTLALYRAAYLSEPSMPHVGKTLLLTFNKALVTYLKYLKPAELRHVRIENYHTFARGYLNSRGKMPLRDGVCSPTLRKNLIEKAVKNIVQQTKRPLDFFMDEIQWMLSHGIFDDENLYINAKRVGRLGTRISKKSRPVMFQILQEYLRLRNETGRLYDWDDIALHVRKELESDNSPRMYKHIIIDEGQDFSPEMIRSLAAAIPDDGSLSFFGDVAQQIYGQRMSWQSANLKILKVWEFKENYRNTQQIARLALAISNMPYFRDIPDLVEPTSPKADGPLPTIAKCKDQQRQIDISIQVALANSQNKSVAILVKNRQQELLFQNKLTGACRLHKNLDRWNDGAGIYHGTYHSAKGLEFDMVILPFLDSGYLPDKDYIASHNEEDALVHDGRLIYVAITRARNELLLLHSSEMTSLLPQNTALYQEVCS